MEVEKREARRRKLAERGTDRLAFITGQIRSLPHEENDAPSIINPPRTDTAAAHGEDAANESMLLKREENNEAAKRPIVADHTSQPSVTTDHKVQPSVSSSVRTSPLIVSAVQNSSHCVAPAEPSHIQPKPIYEKIFTAERIKCSISASENIRLYCSAAIAFLAVVAYGGYDPSTSTAGSILAFRPLFLLLVTDVTIVVGLLLLEYTLNEEDEVQSPESREDVDTDDWANKLAQVLELGLVLQKATNAAFMDCSVYAVLLILGLSLRQFCL